MVSRLAFWVVFFLFFSTAGCNGTGDTGGASANPPSPVAMEASYRFQEADQQLGQGRAAAAVESLRRVVSLEPQNVQARVQLCRALVRAGEHQAAVAQCQRAVALSPDDLELLYATAELHLSAGHLSQAKDTLARILGRAPQDARCHALIGTVHLQQGDAAAAVDSLNAALGFNPQNGAIQAKLAMAFAIAGKCNEAKRALQSAQSLGQDSPALSKSVAACADAVFGTANGKAFLMDRRAVSGLEYSACVDKGVCPRVPYGKYNRQPDYRHEPAMSINYRAAKTYCTYVNKRLPTLAEYQAVWKDLKWQGCCARGVIPREWTDTPGSDTGRSVLARSIGKELETRQGVKKKGYDSNTVRCALDAATLSPSLP